jgi:hypothetical protein
MANRIQLRRDTTANWNSVDPVLADGEPGYDIVTNELRIGNGSNVWSELSANTISGGGGGTSNTLVNGGYIVSLETDGNLTLPNGSVISETYKGSDTYNILLTPKVQPGYGHNPDMAVKIYPTFSDDDHIHITAGNVATVDLFLGDDDQYVKLERNNGNIVIGANADTHHWTFGTDGMTSFPEIDGTKTLWGAVDDDFYIKTTRTDPGNDADIEIIAADDVRLYAEGDQIELYANTSVEINADYNGSSKTWSFGTDGNLTLPEDGTIKFANGVNILSTINGLTSISSSVTTGLYSDASGDFQYGTLSYSYAVNGNNGQFSIEYSEPLVYGNVDISVGNVTATGTANVAGNLRLGGNLLLSSGSQIQSESGTGNVVIETNDGNNVRTWAFETNGNITFPDATTQGTAYQRVTGSWTVTTGSDDYSFTVPLNGTYTMWVRGNIPNGIITWNATATVTNDNVPVLGQQFAWNYNAFNPMPLEITALPVQFIGTANTIINANVYGGGPSNTFTFTVNNASGSSRTVYWGYVAQ